jgi:hypothetical protein
VEQLRRWPLLLAAVTLGVLGVGLDVSNSAAAGLAVACIALSAASLGAFLYAEGARHREWWHRDTRPGDDDGPANG